MSTAKGSDGIGATGEGAAGVANSGQAGERRAVAGPGLLGAFAADESGATSIEYGMLALIMALGIISTISAFPTTLNGILSNVTTNLN
jgi:Flp pilus assembly pilin Flp